jgi:hypothetical protein
LVRTQSWGLGYLILRTGIKCLHSVGGSSLRLLVRGNSTCSYHDPKHAIQKRMTFDKFSS